MVSTNATGNFLEATAKRILERDDYYVYQVRRSPIKRSDGSWFQPKLDIGGGDLIAAKKGERIRLIQVSGSGGIQNRIEEFAKYPWDLNHIRLELWTHVATDTDGMGKAQINWLKKFRVRWSDDDWALVKERVVWWEDVPPAPPQEKQRKLKGVQYD